MTFPEKKHICFELGLHAEIGDDNPSDNAEANPLPNPTDFQQLSSASLSGLKLLVVVMVVVVLLVVVMLVVMLVVVVVVVVLVLVMGSCPTMAFKRLRTH